MLYQTGSYTKTAQNCFLSQSTVSSRISELEKEYGTLFIKNKGELKPTEAGIKLASFSEKILYLYKKSCEEIIHTESSNLSIGCVHAFYSIYFSPHIIKFKQVFPHSHLKFILDHSREIISSIVAGDINIGVSHHPCNYKNYCHKKIIEDDLVLVSGEKNPLYGAGLSISDLKNLPLIYTNFLDQHEEDFLFNKMHYHLFINLGLKAIDILKKEKKYFALLPYESIKEELEKNVLYTYHINNYSLPKIKYYLIYPKTPSEKERQIIDAFLSIL